MSYMESKMQERYDALPLLEEEAYLARLIAERDTSRAESAKLQQALEQARAAIAEKDAALKFASRACTDEQPGLQMRIDKALAACGDATAKEPVSPWIADKLAPIYAQMCALKMSHPNLIQLNWLEALKMLSEVGSIPNETVSDEARIEWLLKRGLCFRGADKFDSTWVVGGETEWLYGPTNNLPNFGRDQIDAAIAFFKGDK